MTIATLYKPEPIQAQENSCGNIPVHFLKYRFTFIVNKWTSHLQYISWQITKNKQVSEDIVQEAFLALWQHRAKIIPDNPVGWLIRVVNNLSARYIRDKNIQIRIHSVLSKENNISYSDVEESLILKEKFNLLKSIFNQLPARQKMVLHLSKEKGWRRAEIAACLQLSPNTVRMHLHRAMQFMKENFPCILLFTMLFITNIIFLKKSSTKEGLMELFKKSYPVSIAEVADIQNAELPDFKNLLQTIAGTTILSIKK